MASYIMWSNISTIFRHIITSYYYGFGTSYGWYVRCGYELLSIIGTFITNDDVGLVNGGSVVFNVLFVIGCCAVFTSGDLVLTWYPFARDCFYYSVSLIILAGFFADGKIYYEA